MFRFAKRLVRRCALNPQTPTRDAVDHKARLTPTGLPACQSGQRLPALWPRPTLTRLPAASFQQVEKNADAGSFLLDKQAVG